MTHRPQLFPGGGRAGIGDPSLDETVVDRLRRRARETPRRRAYTWLADGESEAESLDWGALDARAGGVALALHSAGLAAGDRALLLFPPGLDFVAAFFGCLLSGVVAVPAYPPRSLRRPEREGERLAGIAADAALRAVLTTAEIAAAGPALAAAVPALAGLAWLAAEGGAGVEAPPFEPPAIEPSAIAFLQYTSGSTSEPKGVVVRHANLAANEAAIQAAFGQTEDSIVVGWLPLYHDMGLIGNVLQPLWSGGRCVLMSPVAFLQRPARWLEAIDRYRATTSGGPDFAYALAARKITPQEAGALDLSSWQVAFSGAEPVRAETLAAFARAFAPSGFEREAFYPCYGLAEATLFVAGPERGTPPRLPVIAAFDAQGLERHEARPALPGDPDARWLVGCGGPRQEHRLAIVDPETCRRAGSGRIGEIWVRGPSIADGYWRRPELSAETFGARIADEASEAGEAGYLRTGDLGFEQGGHLFVTGRHKDLIILRGRNHYPQDLERTAEASHPDLHAGGAAAFSVEADGEERLVVAAEVDRRSRAETEEIVEAIRDAVARGHQVQAWKVLLLGQGALPKTTSGKVRRSATRAGYLAGELALWRAVDPPPVLPPEPPPALPGGRDAAPDRAAGMVAAAARALGVAPERLDPSRPLTAQGLDSLGAVELQLAAAALGAAISIADLLDGASLDDLSSRAAVSTGAAPPDGPRPGPAVAISPLSSGQEALYFAERLAPGAYTIAVAARSGDLDAEALERALEQAVARHPALGATFDLDGGEPVQRFGPPRVELISEPMESEDGVEIAARLAALAYRPFDLARDPLVRLARLDLAGGGVAIAFAVHHLVADFASLAVLAREVGLFYRAEVAARLVALPPPPQVLFSDYVAWQRQRLDPAREETLWESLRESLDGVQDLDLPVDHPRPQAQTFRGLGRVRALSLRVGEDLDRFARENGATLFAVLAAVWGATLHRLTGQERFALALPTSGRAAPGLAGLVGYLVQPGALAVACGDDPPFRTHLERIRRAAAEAIAAADYPFSRLAERLAALRGARRDPARPPLAQVAIALEREAAASDLAAFALGLPGAALDLGGVRLEALPLPERRAPFELALQAATVGGALALVIEAKAGLFDPATLDRMLGHVERLLAGAVARPEARLSDLPLSSDEERGQLLGAWSRHPDAREGEGPGAEAARALAPDQVWAHALAAPDREAVRGPGATERLSYGELALSARTLAGALAARGVGPESRVAILAGRSVDAVIGSVAAIWAGAAYLPLDPAHPDERLAFELEDSAPAVLLASADLMERAAGLFGGTILRPSAPPPAPPLAAPVAVDPLHAAYMIYTSGSTGRPKAVVVSRGAFEHVVFWHRTFYRLGVADRTPLLAGPAFDAAVEEIWPTLAGGGCLLLAEESLPGDPARLPAWLARERATVAFLVTPVAEAALAEAWPADSTLRSLFTGGDRLRRPPPPGLPFVLVNHYGPTEAAIVSICLEVPPEGDGSGLAPPIGRPIRGSRAFVADRGGRLAPAGAVGELLLGGDGLARGYLGRPELTAERFVPDPFSGAAGSRLYRTGDLVRFRADGVLDFLGRIDQQVKIRGQRIELGEIEARLIAHPAIREAAVVAFGEGEGRRLAAFVVPRTGADPEGMPAGGPGGDGIRPARGPGVEELRAWLRARLPEAMVPAAFLAIEALPRNANGKVDRRALTPEPEAKADAAPRTPVEAALCGVFAEVLGRERIGALDDLLAAGLHSLAATRAAVRASRALGREVPLAWLFAAPTVAALAERLAATAGGEELPPLVAGARPERIPLSFPQRRLWFLERLQPGTATYHVAGAIDVSGALDEAALAGALRAIADRHEALRTSFPEHDGEPFQRIEGSLAVARCPGIDLQALSSAARERESERLASDTARRPFDLAGGPLARFALLRLDASAARLLAVFHHLIADGASIVAFIAELEAGYKAFAGGRAPAFPVLPPPPIQPADFALWQLATWTGERLAEPLAHFRARLSDVPPLDLPADRPRGARRGTRGGVRASVLPAELAAGVASRARTAGATPFMVLAAAFQALLARLSGQPAVALGTPIANRRFPEVEALIGFFANTLVLDVRLGDDPPFATLLERARESALAAYARQDLPFERLVEELAPRRDLAQNPLFDALFVLEEPLAERRVDGLRMIPRRLATGTAKFDLALALAPRGPGGDEGYDLFAEHAADLFDAATIDRWLAGYARIVEAAVERPAERLSDLPLLSAGERAQLARWSGSSVPAISWEALAAAGAPAPGDLLHAPFFARAAREAGAIALVGDAGAWTYEQLAARALALAAELGARGLRPEERVGVLLPRGPELVAALLGVLAAGGAYVPLEPATPDERLRFLLEDSGARLLISDSANGARAAGAVAEVLSVAEPAREAGAESATEIDPEQIAYLIYTSGSTGRPKSVAVAHKSASAFVRWALAAFSREELSGVLFSTSISFAPSIFELFAPLSCGGTVVLAENALDLPRAAARHPVTLVNAVPSALAEVLRGGGLPESVRAVNLAGEALPGGLVAQIFAAAPGVARVNNLYGPSEDTTYSTWAEIARAEAGSARAASPPIGRPLPGTRAFVAGPRGEPAAVGVPGELLLGGAGLARGYPGRPGLTAERFVPDGVSGARGERLYRTGDRARWTAAGELEVLGRLDSQVEVRAALRGRLPGSLAPTPLAVVDALPRLPNGKLDRRALAALADSSDPAGGAFVPPRTEAEGVLAGIFASVLERERVGIEDDFFALGGHSLRAARAASRIARAFDRDLPVSALFETPTVAGLAARLGAGRDGTPAAAAPPLERTERSAGGAPLSFAQERLWFLERLQPGTAIYNLAGEVALDGPLHPVALAGALAAVAGRHESLRTALRDTPEGPRQCLLAPPAPALALADLSALPWQRGAQEAARLAHALGGRPFDLAREPGLRARLVRLAPLAHRLALALHHTAADGGSLGLLVGEVTEIYSAAVSGRAPRLPELPVQVADFAVWQRAWLASGALAPQLEAWKERLAGLDPLALPADRPRPAVRSGRGACRELRLPATLLAGLDRLARSAAATRFQLLLAGFVALLARLTGAGRVGVGTPVANRRRVEIEPLIGMFVNTLVLDAETADDPPFSTLLARVRSAALAALGRQDLPFERVVEELAPRRELAQNPLFDVLFVLEEPLAPRRIGELEIAPRRLDLGVARLDWTLEATPLPAGAGGGMLFGAEYDADLFDAATIDRWLAALVRLLAAAAATPECLLSSLPLMSSEERSELLARGAGVSARDEPEPELLHARFFEQVERTPGAIAVVGATETWTYADLARRARSIAAALAARGLAPEERVGVLCGRTPDLAAALLGVLAAGGAYVPLDPAYPGERLRFLLADSGAGLLVTSRRVWSGLRDDLGGSCEVLLLDDLGTGVGFPRIDPDQIAYLIYTSGSTGRPKSVAITHRSAAAFVRWALAAFAPAELAGVLFSTSICFDLSIFELFVPLSSGGSLVIAENALDLQRAASRHPVTLVNTVPSALAEIVRAGTLPGSVATINLAGEALPGALVAEIFASAPGVERINNLYGPSEDTTYSTWAGIPRSESDGRRAASPPIGRPLAGSRAYVAGRWGEAVPAGVPGELLLGGAGLARCYLGRPETTAERFVPDGFSSVSGARLYRTGDRVRWSVPGEAAAAELEYLGRLDRQVKVRGYRVEPGEIEAALLAAEGVREAAVAVLGEGAERRLVGYFAGAAEPAAVLAELRRRLPGYLVPSTLVALPAIPRLPNGKVDRRSLPAPDRSTAEEAVAPRGPVEEIVAQVFCLVLGRERVGAREGFFDLGGHSLLATRAVSRLRAAFGVELPVRRLFEGPTVAEVAAAIEELRGGDSGPQAPPLEPLPEGAERPLSFAQERLWFLDHLGAGATYNLSAAVRLRGPLRAPSLAAALSATAARHEVLRTVFPERDGLPEVAILPAADVQVPVIDLAALAREPRDFETRRIARADAARTLDLAHGPLLRAALLRLAADEHEALFCQHHIASDGWSIGVLLGELSERLSAAASGRSAELPALPIQYADYAAWQRRFLSGEELARQVDHWRDALAGVPTELELPLDRPRPAVLSSRGVSAPIAFGADLASRLDALGGAEGATSFLLLAAGFGAVLGRLSGAPALLLGSPVAGRTRTETEGLIGFFVNTLPLRIDLSSPRSDRESDFGSLVARVRERALDAFAHQDLPFERLVEELGARHDPGRTPLVQAVLSFQAESLWRGARLPGLEIEASDPFADPGGSKFELTLLLERTAAGFSGVLQGHADLFDRTTVVRIGEQLGRLLEAAANSPSTPLGDLPVVAAAERHQMLVEWGGRMDAGEPLLWPLRVAAWALREPGRPALVESGEITTYGDLDARARRLARRLRAIGVGAEARVALVFDPSPAALVAILGIHYAGGAYVPIDPAYPPERFAFLLADSAAVCAVTAASLRERVADAAPSGVPVLTVEDEDDLAPSLGADPSAAELPRILPEQLAFVIYTSGSTGVPKGVAISHRALAAYVGAAADNHSLVPEDRSLQFSSLSFDASIEEIFVPLSGGATAVLRGRGLLTAREYFRLCEDERITIAFVSTAYWHQLGAALGAEDLAVPASLRTFGFGGERALREPLAAFRRRAPWLRIEHDYGPTEATVIATRWVVPATGEIPADAPIGRPMRQARVYLVDAELRPVPRGAVGALALGGASLARGYLHGPERTAERFVPDPFAGLAAGAGERLYLTGDLARFLPGGDVQFLGRADGQVKVRGFRVELGEIESVLGRHEAVAMAAVAPIGPSGALAFDGAEGTPSLGAWVVAHGAAPDPADLAAFVARSLPGHMVPSAFAFLPALPLTVNGKVDRRALPRIAVGTESGAAPPETALEATIAAVWCDLFGVERVSVRDNFFVLGGNSLALVRFHRRLESDLGREFPLVRLFEHPTIRALARSFEDDGEAKGERAAAALSTARERSTARRAGLADLERRRQRARSR